MDWVRGRSLGSGSFATVNLATSVRHHFPSLFAVKSSDVSTSSLLINEKRVFERLQSCPNIVKYFGYDHTFENGEECCNLFLEYASGGTLLDHLRKNDGVSFPESNVRRYTRSILQGLYHIHGKGFVHCDIKLQNILVFDDGDVKIADFGLAKEANEKRSKTCELKGTPLFMSPESVNENEYEPPADIWAVGCAVVEMVTGKPAWNVGVGSNIWSLLIRIGVGEELPNIPEELSEEGKDFLRKCFVKDPRKRFTAEMLLKHPFVSDDHNTVSFNKVMNEHLTSSSPMSHFDFPDWDSSTVATSSVTCSPFGATSFSNSFCSPDERLRRLVTEETPQDWSELDGWTNVR